MKGKDSLLVKVAIIVFLAGVVWLGQLGWHYYQHNFNSATEEAVEEPEQLTILFVGDMMLDRHIRQAAEKHGYDYLLAPLRNFLNQPDLVVANLEGPITDSPSVSVNTRPGESDNFIFTFAPAITQLLHNHNIRLVNIGNNHILNFGQDGLEQTVNYLQKAGIDYFGYTGDNRFTSRRIIEQSGFTIGFVNYNQFAKEGYRQAMVDIQALRSQVDYLILYTHWGNEYQPRPNKKIVDLGHEFIEAGVDLIIGSHPHVVQSVEKYQGSKIYYSLGNFVFDQYFSPAVRHGQAVSLTLTSQGDRQFQEYEVAMTREGQTQLTK